MADEVGRLLVRVEADLSQLRRELQRGERQTRTSTRKMGGFFRGLDRNVAQTQRGFSRLRSALAGLGIALGGREAVRAADSYLLLRGRLRLVTDATQDLNAQQSRLFNLAQDTRQAFASTVELFTRVARSSRDLNVSQDKLFQVTEAVNQAIRIGGSTSAEASAGVIQFSQGLASGALRGDELRSVMEQMPRLAIALAEGLGVSIGELRRLGEEGKLTSKAIIDALISQSARLEQEFSKLPRTVGEAMTQLGNELLRVTGEANRASGATDELTGAIDDLRELVGSPGTMQVFETIGEEIGALVRQLKREAETVFGAIGFVSEQIARARALIIGEKQPAFSGPIGGLSQRNRPLPGREDRSDTIPIRGLNFDPAPLTAEQLKAQEKIEKLIGALEDENRALMANERERDKLAVILRAERIAREGNIQVTAEQRQRISELADEQRRLGLEAENLARFEEQVGQAFSEAAQLVDDSLSPQERYNRRIIELNTLLPELTVKLGSVARAQEVLRRASDEAGRELNDSLRDAELGIEQTRDSGSELASGLVSGLRSATDATDGLGDAVLRLSDRVNDAILNIIAFGPLETGLKTAFGPDPLGIASLFSPSTGGAIPQGEVTPLPRRRPDQSVTGLGTAALQATAAIEGTSEATDALAASGDAASDILGNQLATEAVNSAVATTTETAASQTLTVALTNLTVAAETAAAALAAVSASSGGSSASSILGSLSSVFTSASGFSPSTSVGVPATSGFNTAGFSAGPLTFASGGIPPVGVPSIVGEQGPELFVPKVPGRIIPNNQMGRGGGMTVVQSFTFNGKFTAAERAGVLAVARAGGEQAVAGFKARIGRGGEEAKLVGRR